MKLFLLFACFLFSGVINAQQPKFITFKYIPPTAPGLFNGQLIVNSSHMKQPVQFYYTNSDSLGRARIGNEQHILGIGAPGGMHMEILDSACTYLLVDLIFPADSDSLILLDTVMATMPSSVGASDGSITYTMLPTLTPTYSHFTKYAGGATYTYMTIDTNFTGLDQGFYSYKVVDSADINHYMRYDLILYFTSPIPCDHFEMSTHQYPTSPGNCDGVIQMIPGTGLADTSVYHQTMTAYGDGYAYVVNNPGGLDYFSIGKNICPQPVLINAWQHSTSNEYSFFNRAYFIGVDSSGTFVWSPPSGGIPSGLDTLLVSASYTCSLDYSSAPDTVYIDTLIHIGGNLYNFVIVVEQDTTQQFISGTIEADTSGSFFIDFTMYCPDTLLMRSGLVAYKSSRNIVYFGEVILNTVDITKSTSYLLVYPNPANNIITLSSTLNSITHIELLNLNLQPVLVLANNGKSIDIDISKLPQGTYIVKYIDEIGNLGYSRFIKI